MIDRIAERSSRELARWADERPELRSPTLIVRPPRARPGRVPERNRVTPTAEIVAIGLRGAWLGNRGSIHRGHEIVRPWQVRRWITCVLEFRGWRAPMWQPNRWTPLFFHDEAVALAAGHRPCALCRRADYRAFQAAWPGGALGADAMDVHLHADRLDGRHAAPATAGRGASFRSGTFVAVDGASGARARRPRPAVVDGRVRHGRSTGPVAAMPSCSRRRSPSTSCSAATPCRSGRRATVAGDARPPRRRDLRAVPLLPRCATGHGARAAGRSARAAGCWRRSASLVSEPGVEPLGGGVRLGGDAARQGRVAPDDAGRSRRRPDAAGGRRRARPRHHPVAGSPLDSRRRDRHRRCPAARRPTRRAGRDLWHRSRPGAVHPRRPGRAVRPQPAHHHRRSRGRRPLRRAAEPARRPLRPGRRPLRRLGRRCRGGGSSRPRRRWRATAPSRRVPADAATWDVPVRGAARLAETLRERRTRR